MAITRNLEREELKMMKMDKLSSVFRASFFAKPGDEILIHMTGNEQNDMDAIKGLRRLFDPLKVAYEEVFQPSFGLAHDLEKRSVWLQRLLGWSPTISNAVILCGQNLSKENGTAKTVKALRVAEFYKGCGAGQLTWVAVNKESRKESLGLMMVLLGIRSLQELARRNGENLGATVIEVNNPDKVSAAAYSDAGKAVYDTFRKWGARFVPMGYLRPNVARGDLQKTDEFSLMVYPDSRTGRYPGKEEIRQALRGIYINEGIENPDADPDFQAMSRQLETVPEITEVNTDFVETMSSFENWLGKHMRQDGKNLFRLDQPFRQWIDDRKTQRKAQPPETRPEQAPDAPTVLPA